MDNKEKLLDIISRISKYDIIKKTSYNDIDLIKDYDFDSIKFVELIVELEYEFRIIINDEDINVEVLNNFSSLLEMVNRKVQDNMM